MSEPTGACTHGAARQAELCRQGVETHFGVVADPAADPLLGEVPSASHGGALEHVKGDWALDETCGEGDDRGAFASRLQETVGARDADHVGAADDGCDRLFTVRALPQIEPCGLAIERSRPRRQHLAGKLRSETAAQAH